MRRPIVIAVLSTFVVVAILMWRGLSPVEPVGLSNVTAQPVMGTPGEVTVSLTIETGDAPDVLIGVSSPAAERAALVNPLGLTQLAMPARGTPGLSLDGSYIRLSGIEGPIDDGRLVPVTLTFLRSGEVTARARVAVDEDPHAKHRAMAAMTGVEPGDVSPGLSLALDPAADGATLVRLTVENFVFAPDSETPEHVAGQGHGHLYLDGVKLQRMYGAEALIGALPPGRYQVRVDLNSNLHVPYRTADGPVQAQAELVVE